LNVIYYCSNDSNVESSCTKFIEESRIQNEVLVQSQKERRYSAEHKLIQNWSIAEWRWIFKLKDQVKELIKSFHIKKITLKSC